MYTEKEEWENEVCINCTWFHLRGIVALIDPDGEDQLKIYECLHSGSDFSSVLLYEDKYACEHFQVRD